MNYTYTYTLRSASVDMYVLSVNRIWAIGLLFLIVVLNYEIYLPLYNFEIFVYAMWLYIEDT